MFDRKPLPVVADEPVDPSRRAFMRTAAAGAAVAALSSCGVEMEDFPRAP